MKLNQIDFSKVLNDDQVYHCIMANYDKLGNDWLAHQWNWLNMVYAAFKDHYKYMIIISLVEKTLQFYDQMKIVYSYDEYYSKPYVQIEQFSISEICEKINLPKETVRRKVIELENLGVLKRQKKKILIDRSAFNLIKPENQLKITSKYIHQISQIFNKEKTYSKKLEIGFVENTLKKNFSLTWRWFYRMQIPMAIGYHEIFGDLTTFHIWGTCCMNQAYNYKKNINKYNILTLSSDYATYNKNFVSGDKNTDGVSAMSISEMTGIPRATVVRKCKDLVEKKYLKLNEKKHYFLSGLNIEKVVPYQKQIFKNKAKFLRKILNLLLIS